MREIQVNEISKIIKKLAIEASIIANDQLIDKLKESEKAEEEARKVEDAAQAERDRLDQIARDERPEGEVATGIEFGKSTTKDKMGSVGDFAVPTSGGASGLAATGKTGLGFSI